ncbi:MAG: Fibronectin type domain protein [Acidobacteria bacterium]|nr:Fibronectin type domain protein [Acidobacteriota bacterium]
MRPSIFAIPALAFPLLALAATTVPNEIQQPGTQPLEVAAFQSPDNCDNCHSGITQPTNPGLEPERDPGFGWRGGMMGNAGRDPLFWGTLAIAEQDFIPNADPAVRGGAGDLCIRCHSVGGWVAGRSTPTDGSGLSQASDKDGVECEFCHLLVNPDPPVNVAGTVETHNPPFEPYDAAPSSEAYRGSGMYVINGGGTRLGPYNDANAKHAFLASPFHRQSELCATCHDVSNAAVGDLAHNNGTQNLPLAPASFSGILGAPLSGKAAFNNPPYKYGMVERTSSEHVASAFDTLRVSDFGTLPADLRVAGGSIQKAYQKAMDQTGNPARPNYKDGTIRYFTCQTCHMAASTGLGCNKAGTPLREDLPRHDQTGASHWVPDAVKYMDTKGTLRLGGGLTQVQRDALDAGKIRAQDMIKSAASLSASQQGSALVVRVTNLTAHKLISGYPEGRRMWLNVKWYDAANALVREDGAYGAIGRTVQDNAGIAHAVQSLLDLHGTVVYEAKPGLDQQWAAQLLSLGYSPDMPLGFDRMTDVPDHTLGQLAASPAGTQFHTFHFVLNNVMTEDNRIPPYGFKYDEARLRNSLPVPPTQYGAPPPGGTYNYWDERPFTIPPGATRAEVRLLYQQTSWEYVQFLWKGNDRLNTFLGNEGVNLLDAWLNTGQAAPVQIALATAGVTPPAATPGQASRPNVSAQQMRATYNRTTGSIDITYTPACGSSNHTIYFGDLSGVSTYNYTGASCNVGISGAASFNPGAGSAFFLVVGHNGSVEGSYGHHSSGVERPEDTATPGCDVPQSLAGSCDPP